MISGAVSEPTSEDVKATVESALATRSTREMEIAFFGGSFTAIRRDYMLSLLSVAHSYVKDGKVQGIRLSTRPDCIDSEILDILKHHGVTSIELGAQSMSDSVLCANLRGHNRESIFKSAKLIKQYGFELGLQIMTGLYRDSKEQFRRTVTDCLDIHPDTVRIYPTLVLPQTFLWELMESGEYSPLTLEEAIELASEAMERFMSEGIRIIKVGLHSSDTLLEDARGPYHPAFRELCEGEIMRKRLAPVLSGVAPGEITVAVSSKDYSKLCGHGGRFLKGFAEQGFRITVETTSDTEPLQPILITKS